LTTRSAERTVSESTGEIDQAISGRISRELPALDDHAVLVAHGLSSEVDDLEVPADGIGVERDQIVEPHQLANPIEVAIVLGGLGDGDGALDAGGDEGVVGDRPEHRSVGDHRLDGPGLVRIPVPDEVRLQHDPSAPLHERSQGIPFGAAEALRVEPRATQGLPDGGVDVVRRTPGGVLPEECLELRVGLPGAVGGREALVARAGSRESDVDHRSILPTFDFTARNFPFASRGIAST
jgi:hypothetical protein